MSKKRTKYTSAFKTKLVLELLQNMDGSMAISALARKVFFQFCRFCGRMLCLLAICTRVLLFCNNSSTNFVLNAERTNNTKQAIKNHSTQVFEQIPIYGERKVHQQLLEDGFKVSLNTVTPGNWHC
jgi:hypothetical protein